MIAGLLCAAMGAAWADARLDALAQARHDLAISEQVLVRLTERVAVARAVTRPDEGARLDAYLARVQALVTANRERVRSLEQDLKREPARAAGAGTPAAMTPAERVAMLDGELNGSLEAFDQLLLDEARKARTRDAETKAASRNGAAGGSGKGSAATGNGESGDESADAASEKGNGNAGGSGSERATERGPRGATPDGSPGGASGGREGGAPGQTASTPPPDVGNGNDDDIVARQIRKAAESEPDPELRKKLWDEYRKYKQGVAPGAS